MAVAEEEREKECLERVEVAGKALEGEDSAAEQMVVEGKEVGGGEVVAPKVEATGVVTRVAVATGQAMAVVVREEAAWEGLRVVVARAVAAMGVAAEGSAVGPAAVVKAEEALEEGMGVATALA